MRVLIVDDSVTMRRIVIDSLRSLAVAEIVEAASGEEALEVLRRSPDFALVLLDWHLPGMTGLDLIRAMQEDSRLAKIPVVMVTSEREKPNVIAALRTGARNYIVKPFTQQVFRKKVGALLSPSEEEGPGPAGRLVGNLGQTSPLEVVQLISMTKKTGVLEFEGPGGQYSLYFENGQIVHAEGEQLAGEEAFAGAASLAEGVFSFRTDIPHHPVSVRRSTDMILLDAFKRASE